MTLSYELKQYSSTLPNLFLVAAAKSGSSSLHTYLSLHKDIFMSRVKEPHYFSYKFTKPLNYREIIATDRDYLDLFKNAHNYRYTGESSTSYLPCPETPKLISKTVDDPYIIIGLRDPIERAYSHYLMEYNAGGVDTSFFDSVTNELDNLNNPEILSHLHLYHYTNCVKRYINEFGKERVKIIFFENWTENPLKEIISVLEFLQLDTTGYNPQFDKVNQYREKNILLKMLNRNQSIMSVGRCLIPKSLREKLYLNYLTKKVGKPKIDEESRQKLYKIYEEDIAELRELIKVDLPWKNFM